MLCPIAWRSCYTLVNLGISFKFFCSKSEHVSFMLLHTSEVCYPCNKQPWSVPPEEDLVLCCWQGWDSKGPCVPSRRCWLADKHGACFMEKLHTSGACQILVCSGIPLEGILGHCQALQSDVRRRQGRTPPKLHKHTDCVTELASGDSCGMQQGT